MLLQKQQAGILKVPTGAQCWSHHKARVTLKSLGPQVLVGQACPEVARTKEQENRGMTRMGMDSHQLC